MVISIDTKKTLDIIKCPLMIQISHKNRRKLPQLDKEYLPKANFKFNGEKLETFPLRSVQGKDDAPLTTPLQHSTREKQTGKGNRKHTDW